MSFARTRESLRLGPISIWTLIFLPVLLALVLGRGADAPTQLRSEAMTYPLVLAMVGAVVIGLVTELSAAAWSPDYKQVVAFVILVAVMVLRPQGLLAKRGALAAAG